MISTGLKWIGMATAATMLMAAGMAHAQESDNAPAAQTDTSKPKPKVKKPKPKVEQTADDQTNAKPKAKAKAKAKAKVEKLPFVTVTVSNGRSVELVELSARIAGSNGDAVTVAKKLPGGKKTTAKLAHDKDCLFDISGVFDDGQAIESSGVELCKDKKINLTD